MKISLMMLTIDRFEITRESWRINLANAMTNLPANVELEFLVCDNGSTDRRVVDYFKTVVHYHRANSRNEGVGHAFNQLFLRSTGDVIAMVGPDLRNDPGWLWECARYALEVPNSGIIGLDWGHGQTPPVTMKNGHIGGWLTPKLDRVFGTWVFRRRLIDEIGFFHEGFGPYGMEDSDFNERVNRAGFNSCYHPTLRCKHVCNDVGEKSAYRRMKDESLQKNSHIFWARHARYNEDGIREPLPPRREPL